MIKKNRNPVFVSIIFLLSLTHLACILGDIPAANEFGNNPDHIATLTAQATLQQEEVQTSTETVNVTPTATNTALDMIPGTWTGTAQWMCDDNPVWNMSMDFRVNETVIITLSGPGETTSAEGKWVLQDNKISIQLQTNFWYGTVSEKTIKGSFEENDCSGVWKAQKK
jgi:hypothetical protein